MAAKPGTLPFYPPYQPGALTLTGNEITYLVSTSDPNTAASYRMPITDLVGKAPSAIPGVTPLLGDRIAFFRSSAGTPGSCTIQTLSNAISPTNNTVFNVTLFGATGNGATDDTSAINLAIAAFNTAGKGILYFPAGTYLVTSSLTTITALGIVRGDGRGNIFGTSRPLSFHPPTVINCNSASAVVFNCNTPSLVFYDMAIVCKAVSPTTASRGIASIWSVDNNPRVDLHEVTIAQFYINMDIQVGANWVIDSCDFLYAPQYGVSIQNTQNVDTGDWCISNCNFIGSVTGAVAGIFQSNSGGGKIVNCKFNQDGSGGGFTDCINTNLALSSDLMISNCSFEGFNGTALTVVSGASEPLNLVMSNCQIASSSSSATFIHVTGGQTCSFSNLSVECFGVGRYVFKFDSTAVGVSINNIAVTAGVLGIIDPAGSAAISFSLDSPFDYHVSSDVPTSTTVLSNVTGLSIPLQANTFTTSVGFTYSFDGYLSYTCSTTSGIQVALATAGGLVASNLRYDGFIVDSPGAILGNAVATTFGVAVANSTTTGVHGVVRLFGELTTSTTGTLNVQFAQNATSGTATTIKRGSRFSIRRIANA